MKNIITALLLLILLLPSCATKSQFQTREGKAKNKHYNDIQYKKDKKWGK